MLESRVARLESDVAHIQSDVTDIKRKLDTVGDDVVEIKLTLAKMNGRQDNFDTKLDAMDEKFEAKFDAMDKRLDAMDEKFEAKFDAMDKKFDHYATKADLHDGFARQLKWMIGTMIALVAAVGGIGAAVVSYLNAA